MSHNIEHFDYPENVDKAKVEKDLDNYVAHADYREGASGLPGYINWRAYSGICDSYNAAMKKIEELDRGRYNQIAVRYYERDRSTFKASAKLTKLGDKRKSLEEKLRAITNVRYFETVTSDMVGCKNCGSKISRKAALEHNVWNRCPVCDIDMRPKTTRDRIAKLRTEIEETQKDYATEYEICVSKMKKGDVRWLVKIEYHT